MEKRSFLQLLQKALSYWPILILLVAACCTAAWAYTRTRTPLYEATATMMIKDDHQSSLASSFSGGALVPSNTAVESEMEVIRSKSLMKEVALNLGLYAPVMESGDLHVLPAYSSSPIAIRFKAPQQIRASGKVPFRYDAQNKLVQIGNKKYPLEKWVQLPYGELMFVPNTKLEQATANPLHFELIPLRQIANVLRNNLNLGALSKGSSVIVLRFRDVVPRRAEDILNEVSRAYDQASLRNKGATTANTLAFLEDRIRLVEEELDSLENRIRNYKSRKGIVDLSTQGQMFISTLSANDQKVAALNNQLAVLNQIEKYVVSKDKKAGIVPATLGVTDPMLNGLLEKLYASEANYERLGKTVPENNPMMVALRTDMNKIRPSLLESIRNQRISIQASMGSMNQYNKSYNSMLRTIPQKEKDLLDYTRQQAIKNSVYTFLLQKREETAMVNSSTVSDSRIIDDAEATSIPNGPGKPVVYTLAVLLGILLTAAIIWLKEITNTKFRDRAQLEASTTAPVIAELAYTKAKPPVYINREEHIVLHEQFRHLRVALGLFGKVRHRKKVLITSSIPEEGKSFVSTNLAISLAESGKKVVLIDLDLRNPQNTRHFNLQGEQGVSDYLHGELELFEIVRSTQFDNLHFIPAGNGDVVNAVELLLNGKLEQLFTYLLEHFEYVLLDTAPVEMVSDAFVLSEYCDQTVFVVRQGFTPHSILQLSEEHRKIKRLKNPAIVLNGVRHRRSGSKQYGYGYGYVRPVPSTNEKKSVKAT